jgi:hypothetical protein
MTTSVALELRSPDFEFESGRVFFTKGARFNSPGEFEPNFKRTMSSSVSICPS